MVKIDSADTARRTGELIMAMAFGISRRATMFSHAEAEFLPPWQA